MYKHFSRPIFSDYLLKIGKPPLSNAIIAVFDTGEVFLIPLDDDPHNYVVNPYSELEEFLSPVMSSDSPDMRLLKRIYLETPLLAHNTSLSPRCIGSIKLSKAVDPVKIEFTNDGSNLLIVYGILHRNVPSIGVYLITQSKMMLVYADSVMSVADITYSSYYHSLVLIPRLSQTSIFLIDVQTTEIPAKYQPRFLPEIVVAGSHLKRTVHLSPAGCHKWHALSWSDEICPSLIAWHFSPPGEPEKTWAASVIDILVPCNIQFVCYDQYSDRIGFIVQNGKDSIVSVWDLENRNLVQYNIKVPNLEQILHAKWASSVMSSEIVFTISSTTGYYEHQKDQVMRWKDPLDRHAQFFRDDSGNRFYFNDSGELKIVTAPVFYENVNLEKVETENVAPYPIIQNYLNGSCDKLSCLHLYRCANCRRPLLFPLVSRVPEHRLQNCYCSEKCQKEHWPAFFAIHQPIQLQIDRQ